MSYDLAIWVGEQFPNDEPVEKTYENLVEQLEHRENPPASEIVKLIDQLQSAFDEDLDSFNEGPWAAPPLNDAAGNIVVLSFLPHHADAVRIVCGRVAAAHGAICFDPQSGSVV